MKHISILVLEGSTLTSLDGTRQLLSRVNDFLAYRGQKNFYEIDLVAAETQQTFNNGLYRVSATKTIHEQFKTDLIIIPIICGDFSKMNYANKAFTDWTIAQYRQGCEIASLCVGSFFLASTGILDGKVCATHWASQNDFKNMFPRVKVLEETIITDEHGIYTSGGTYSYLNLLLYIIEKHLGREISILASKMFEIDIERKTQHQFAIFLGQKRHHDTEVLKAQDYIESNTHKKIAVNELCAQYAIQRRTFERRFKKATGNSVSEYIQRVKVEVAKKQLEVGRKTINEIVFEVGYSDLNTFRDVFRKFVGMTPVDYRNKYKN